jgi:hypothetical protein
MIDAVMVYGKLILNDTVSERCVEKAVELPLLKFHRPQASVSTLNNSHKSDERLWPQSKKQRDVHL